MNGTETIEKNTASEITTITVYYDHFDKKWIAKKGLNKIDAGKTRKSVLENIKNKAKEEEPSKIKIYSKDHDLKKTLKYGLKKDTKRS